MQADEANGVRTEPHKPHEINDTIILMGRSDNAAGHELPDSRDLPQDERKMLNLHVNMLRSHSAAIEALRDRYSHPALNEVRSCVYRDGGSSLDNRETGPAMVMLRPFIQTPDPTDGKVIAAINLDVYNEDSSQLSKEMAAFWGSVPAESVVPTSSSSRREQRCGIISASRSLRIGWRSPCRSNGRR